MMITSNYLQYIPESPDHKKYEIHKSLMTDVFYLYHGIKPTKNQKIICITNDIFDLSKENLKLV